MDVVERAQTDLMETVTGKLNAVKSDVASLTAQLHRMEQQQQQQRIKMEQQQQLIEQLMQRMEQQPVGQKCMPKPKAKAKAAPRAKKPRKNERIFLHMH